MVLLAAWERGQGLRRQVWSAVREEPAHTLVLKLTLVLTLLQGSSASLVEVAVRLLATTLLIFPALLLQPALWWLLTVALAAGNARDWFLIDNHHYLITYWVLACTISLHARERHAWLASVARVMTALVFGLAVLWKVVGGEFLSGGSFYYTFLTDPRLTPLGALVTGTPLTEVALIPRAVDFLGEQGALGSMLVLPSAPGLFTVALGLSWLTLAVEGSVGALHIPGGQWLYAVRHTALMAFVVLTYLWLPVTGLASVLLLMGLAQCRAEDRRLRFRYLVLLGMVQLTLLPWDGWLRAWVE